MTTVTARLAPGREIDSDSFVDLTTTTVTAVQWTPDGLAVTFDATLPATVEAAVRNRMTSRDSAEEALLTQARAAYTGNQDYLAIPAPTAGQIRDQVAALTRQVNALIRLAVDR